MASNRHRDAALGYDARELNKSMPSQESKLKDRQRIGSESCQNHARAPRHPSINSHRLLKRPSTGLPVSSAGNLRCDIVGGSSEHECTKQLLLLHLEFIQQLQEQLKAKDMEITRLANERDQMAVKVQRMERRMVLLQRRSDGQRVAPSKLPKIYKPDYPDSDDCDILEKSDPFGSSKKKGTNHAGPSTRKMYSDAELETWFLERHSEVKHSPVKSVQPTKQKTGALSSSKISAVACQGNASEPLHHKPCATNFSVDSSNPSTPASGPSISGPPSPWMQIEPPVTPPAYSPMILGDVPADSGTTQADCVRTRFCNVLYEGTYRTHEMDELDIQKTSQDSIIKVPMWRIRSLHGHKSKNTLMEDTSDITYLKRHNKSEAEEKRIKRWDIRRIRQQRQNEALKKRYSDSNVQRAKVTRIEEEPAANTFLPNPDLLVSVEVADDIPVSAFGQPLPLLQKQREFELPWFNVRSRSTSTKTPRKRKKLKGRLFHRST